MTALSSFFGGPSGSLAFSEKSSWKCNTITSSTTFTPIPGITEYSVILVGGGASGAASTGGYYYYIWGGCGGKVTIFDVHLNAEETASIVIGSGGSAVTNSGGPAYFTYVAGISGGDSSFTVSPKIKYTAQGGIYYQSYSYDNGSASNGSWGVMGDYAAGVYNTSKYILFDNSQILNIGHSNFTSFLYVPTPGLPSSSGVWHSGGSSYIPAQKKLAALNASGINGYLGCGGSGACSTVSGNIVTSGKGGDGICFIWWRE